MFSGMYSTGSALESIERYHEVIARNLANINTPGYRRQAATFQSIAAQHKGVGGTRNHGTDLSEAKFDFTLGAIEETGRELDVAIEGDGFFELETEQGPIYTRNGVFFIGQDGALVTSNGLPVNSESGPIQFANGTTPDQVKISTDGTIYADELQVGKLKIVAFDNPQRLKPRGTVLFEAPKSAGATESTAVVRQGVRERSNVNATQQLVKLITGMRHHEAAQRAMRSMSETIAQRLQPN